MDEAVKSRPQRPSQCAPTEYPNAGRREQGIEGRFSLREFLWEHAYRKNILDPRDILSRRDIVAPWRMVAFKPGEHGKVIVANMPSRTLLRLIEISNQRLSNQHQQSASQQLLSVSVASGLRIPRVATYSGVWATAIRRTLLRVGRVSVATRQLV
jgi:hypothetical protein